MGELDEDECGKPCAPEHACENCMGYWNRMRHEGFWDDRNGWTAKGMREMCK